MAKIDEIKARRHMVSADGFLVPGEGGRRDIDWMVGEVERLTERATRWEARWRALSETSVSEERQANRWRERTRELEAEVERLSTKVEALEGVNRDQAVAIGKLARELAEQKASDSTQPVEPVPGAPHPDVCTFREPDSCSGVYRCFLQGGGGYGAIGKGDTEALAYADFVAKWVAAKAEATP